MYRDKFNVVGYDSSRIKKTPKDGFRSVLKAEDIILNSSNGTDTILLERDNSLSVLFDIERPLVIPDTRIWKDKSVHSIDEETFYNIVLGYLYINQSISFHGIKNMATYLIKRYSAVEQKERVRYTDTGQKVTSTREVALLHFEEVFEFIRDVLNSNPSMSFYRLPYRIVYILYSRDCKLGYNTKKSISLSYYSLARKHATNDLIRVTIHELAEQDNFLKITNSRISDRSNLVPNTIRRNMNEDLYSLLKDKNMYRKIGTRHSFEKFKDFILVEGLMNKSRKEVCNELSINNNTYSLFKEVLNSITKEELDNINDIKY